MIVDEMSFLKATSPPWSASGALLQDSPVTWRSACLSQLPECPAKCEAWVGTRWDKGEPLYPQEAGDHPG